MNGQVDKWMYVVCMYGCNCITSSLGQPFVASSRDEFRGLLVACVRASLFLIPNISIAAEPRALFSLRRKREID